MADFIQELSEARMLRRIDAVKGMDVNELTSRLFNHLLALRIVLDRKPAVGKKYVDEILLYPAFNVFKATSPDLYNMLVLVLRQYAHADKLLNNWGIDIPELRLRKILRGWAAGDRMTAEFNRFMIVLQRQIPNIDPFQMTMRRVVVAGKEGPDADTAIRRLVINMRETGIQSDLWQILRTVA